MPAPPAAEPPTVLAQADAPAKAILVGEHAVVYGRPAIAIPVPQLRTYARVLPGEGSLTLSTAYQTADGLRAYEVDLGQGDDTAPLAVAARAALRHAGRTLRTPWRVELTSEIPAGRGLGSSAAMAVAVVRALGLAAGEDWPPQTVADLALEAERAVHGQASGIDTAVAAHGIPIRFQEGRARALALSGRLGFVIADTGTRGSTAAMVAAVRERQARQPQIHADWFDRIGRLADDAARALAQDSPRLLGQLMNANHLLLQALEVSTPALDSLVAAARGSGALGAKLTGSGGGGAVLVLVGEAEVAGIVAALEEAGAVTIQHLVLGAGG